VIDEIQFSEMGKPVTVFEQRLLATVVDPSAIGALAVRLVREHGPQVGAQALATVLDELGPGRVYVPARGDYFRRLWVEERDQLINSLAARPDWPVAEIAGTLGVDRSTVWRVINRNRAR
jgi:transcriptional regulator of acetoin/glycerol metabolism